MGISADSGFRLKGVDSRVDYRFNSVGESGLSALNTAGASGLKSPAVDSYYQSIGRGSIVKSASSLAALESFEVTGAYAKTIPMLYTKEIILTLVVIAIFVLVVVVLARRIFRRGKLQAKDEGMEDALRGYHPSSAFVIILASLASAVSLVLYTGLNYLFISYVLPIIFGGYSYNFGIATIHALMWVLIVIVDFVIYVLLLIGPSILIGIKRRPLEGVITFIATLIWLVLIIILLVGLSLLVGGGDRNPYYFGAPGPLSSKG